jgi:hypothetical protein
LLSCSAPVWSTYMIHWRSLLKKGGEYCKEVKKFFISLDPPPEPSSVVVVKRKYSSLARDLNHKKRVTWCMEHLYVWHCHEHLYW